MFPNETRTMQDFQEFHRWLDEQKASAMMFFLNMMLLSGGV